MISLSENNIHLGAQAANKQQVIEMVAQALEKAGYVESGYLQGLLAREQQTSTYLGNGIAIPHGTLDTRSMVKKTGVQVFQFPQGIEWGEGNIAHIVIGIAASSDEHLTLLRQLTHVLGDEDVSAKLVNVADVQQFRALLMGESELEVNADNIALDVETNSLLALTAMNAEKLQQQGIVSQQFVADVIASPALPLTDGLWVTDSVNGNLKNGLALSRAKDVFSVNGKNVKAVLTIAAQNDQINATLARLLDKNVQNQLLNGDVNAIVTALNGKASQSCANSISATENASDDVQVIGTFSVRNDSGLHARPVAQLVKIVKQFDAKVSVQNLSRDGAPVSASSTMRLLALGATKDARLRFVAQGAQAQQAIEAIQQGFAEGLGETLSSPTPAEADQIEIVGKQAEQTQPPSAVENAQETAAVNQAEGIFVIKNEHGIHARPGAMLVKTVKSFNASVEVQNLDRETALVSAKNLMKIVALGATKGTRLRFVATGDDAQAAIDGIGAAIEAGLGE